MAEVTEGVLPQQRYLTAATLPCRTATTLRVGSISAWNCRPWEQCRWLSQKGKGDNGGRWGDGRKDGWRERLMKQAPYALNVAPTLASFLAPHLSHYAFPFNTSSNTLPSISCPTPSHSLICLHFSTGSEHDASIVAAEWSPAPPPFMSATCSTAGSASTSPLP